MYLILRKVINWTVVLVSLVGIVGMTPAVRAEDSAEAKKAVCEGIGSAFGGDDTCEDPEGSASLDSTVKNVINILSLVVGVIAVIIIIVGGVKYVTSQGDSSGVTSAKNTVIYAIVGLVIVALAQVIVRFVAGRVSDQ